jgi:hypothetical protein
MHPKLAENTILHENASTYSADAVRNAVWHLGVRSNTAAFLLSHLQFV